MGGVASDTDEQGLMTQRRRDRQQGKVWQPAGMRQIVGPSPNRSQVPDAGLGSDPSSRRAGAQPGLVQHQVSWCPDLESQHLGLQSLDLPLGIGPRPGLGVGKRLLRTGNPGNLASPSGKQRGINYIYKSNQVSVSSNSTSLPAGAGEDEMLAFRMNQMGRQSDFPLFPFTCFQKIWVYSSLLLAVTQQVLHSPAVAPRRGSLPLFV